MKNTIDMDFSIIIEGSFSDTFVKRVTTNVTYRVSKAEPEVGIMTDSVEVEKVEDADLDAMFQASEYQAISQFIEDNYL